MLEIQMTDKGKNSLLQLHNHHSKVWGRRNNKMMMNLIHDTRHLYTHFGIDGIKAMLRSISEGKQVIKFANTSNCSCICLFYQNTVDSR